MRRWTTYITRALSVEPADNAHPTSLDPEDLSVDIPITEEEVIKAIGGGNTATDPDGIRNTILRQLPTTAITFLMFLFSSCLSLDIFPTQCKSTHSNAPKIRKKSL